jgi:hypothetical protein
VGEIRERCAHVAAAARHVRVNEQHIALYAAALPAPPPATLADRLGEDERRARAAFWLTLDAINFGSGWFPTLRKRPGRSGYWTIATGLREQFDRRGPWEAAELARLGASDLASVMGQDPGHELMALFATSLQDLGEHMARDYGGAFDGPLLEAGDSAVALVERLSTWDCFADASVYDGVGVPFLKRAQIAAADVERAGAARFRDLDALTMFADNLVPHVLRLDGILAFDPALVARIERGELIEHGSADEVEIRACAVHAVELIVASSPAGAVNAAEVDQILWSRGQGRSYKAAPRHRSRCTAY